MIKSVDIYFFNFHECIFGFKFYDKEHKLIFKIGAFDLSYSRDTVVVLEDNEVIFRVVAKLYENWQFSYTDFQFKIASRWD
jgi:hypothetical protein